MPLAWSCSPRWAIGRFNQSSASRAMICALIRREDGVDLHCGAKWQARTADGNAGVPSLLPKYLYDQLRRTVDYLGMIEETGRGIDKAVETHALDDAVEVTERGLGLGENIERTEPRRFPALGDVEPSAKSTGHCKLPVLQRQLASYKELAAQMQERDVIGDGEGNLGQGEVQGLKPCFDHSGHGVSN